MSDCYNFLYTNECAPIWYFVHTQYYCMYLWVFLYDSGCDIVYRDDHCMHAYLLAGTSVEGVQCISNHCMEAWGHRIHGQETVYMT